MFYYVYISPDVFDDAISNGAFAMQSLIGVLRGFEQNCFIAEFEDFRLQEALKQKVNEITDDNDRKEVKILLAVMAKRNRFIYCLLPDYIGSKSEHEMVFEQATTSLIDLIMLSSAHPAVSPLEKTAVATLANYQHSNFEKDRAYDACNGATLKDGEMFEHDFLDRNFKKALRYASIIEICDKLFGKYFSDNFIYSTKKLFEWMNKTLAEPKKCKLVFHCEKPDGKADVFIKSEIEKMKKGHIADLEIVVQFYDPSGGNCLPHDRYILTDQIAVDFGRGMDFVDKDTHQNRDITINIKDLKQVGLLLDSYKAGRLTPIVI